MRRAFFGTYWRGGLGAVGRCLRVAEQLQARGVACFFFAEGVTAELVARAGFQGIAPPPVAPPRGRSSSPHVSQKRVVGDGAVFRNLSQFYGLRGYGDADYVANAFETRFDAIRRIDPDILFGYWSWEATIAARILRKPLVTIIQKNLHPQGGGFASDDAGAQDTAVLGAFNALLAKHALASIEAVEDLMVGDVTLMSGVPSTDSVPAPVTYCGPILWFARDGEEVLAQLPAGRKIAWVYATDDPDWVGGRTLIRDVVPALERMGLFVLVSSGGYSVPRIDGPNVLCVGNVPGDLAARRADLVVGRGGHDLFWTAITARKPFLGVPPNSEWLDYCRHARRLGVGDYVEPSEPLAESVVGDLLQRREAIDALADEAARYSIPEIADLRY